MRTQRITTFLITTAILAQIVFQIVPGVPVVIPDPISPKVIGPPHMLAPPPVYPTPYPVPLGWHWKL